MPSRVLIDFSSQTGYLWALLPEIVLTICAMSVLMVDVFKKEARSESSHSVVAWLALGSIILTAVANGWLGTFREASPLGMIAVDEFRIFTNFIFLLAGALFVLIAPRYFEQENMSLGELYVLVLLSIVGMMVFAASRDLMVTFLGLELMSVPVYVLTGANRRSPRSAEAALKYFLLGAFSSAFMLFGIAMVYGGAGTVNITRLGEVIGAAGAPANGLVIGGMALLAVGFGFKVAAVPFHMWTPDAYDGAPAPIAGFMASAVKAAAFAAFIRVFLTAFPGIYGTWGEIIFWMAAITMVGANLVGLVQGNVKRMLAYSSIAHAGYLLVALAAANAMGAAAFLFYLAAYTLMTMGAFAIVHIVGRRGEVQVGLDSYAGLGWQRPFVGIAMTVFLLSLAGFPLTGGFIGKVFILRAAIERGMVALAVVLVLTSLLSYWYYLRVAWYMWFREPAEGGTFEGIATPGSLRVALAIAIAGTLILGIFPGPVLDLAEHAATALIPVSAEAVAR